MKRNLFIIISIFIINIIIFSCMIKLFSTDSQNNKKNITTSFYPIYIITKNLIKDCPNLSVTNMTPNAGGCLHDYQLTSKDMKNLEQADLLIINGAGMESFLTDITSSNKNLDIVDSCYGMKTLEDNSHVWLSPSLYREQVKNIYRGLLKKYPEYSFELKENQTSYLKKIESIEKKISHLKKKTDGFKCIIFHESFAYIAKDLGIQVCDSIEIDDSSALSSKKVSQIINEVNELNIPLLFTELQYESTIADSISKETLAQTVVFDSLVGGDGSLDSYINGMNSNLELLGKLTIE